MMALRTAFLTLHVAGGAAGLLLGAFVLRPPEPGHHRLALRRGYAAAIAVLVGFLIARFSSTGRASIPCSTSCTRV
jgi:hypothetical protein